jgi:HAD superfamily hydrolase (TIGR01509 family)
VAGALTGSKRVLLLDVMETLVHEPFYREVPAFFGTSLEELIEAKHPTAWADFERGEIDEVELEARFFRDGRAYDHAGMRARMEEAYAWIDGMEELLAELKASSVEMHALSNYPDWYLLIERKLKLSRFLHWTFVSCRTGHRKPAPEAYRAAIDGLGVPPEELLFVDDREENCAAARALGIESIRFRGVGPLREALVGAGVLR